jgi:hypothetical protein
MILIYLLLQHFVISLPSNNCNGNIDYNTNIKFIWYYYGKINTEA